jgi:hypothetical protein
MYRLRLRIRSVLSDRIAKQKTWFLLCSGGFAAALGLSPGGIRQRKLSRILVEIFYTKYNIL